uniref:Uncharacterized protein n=1 Tax=Pantoea phage Survivor TaxID=3232176 RepID=A0AAU8KZE8_9CAUD
MNRNLGTIPISVGTALALEILTGTPMHKYHALMFNLRTLIRNTRQAYDDVVPGRQELFEAVRDDVKGIAEFIVSLKLRTTLELKFYYPSYKSLPRLFPLAKLKDVKVKGTQLQKDTLELDEWVANKICDEFGQAITKNDSVIPRFPGDALIMTHHPVDLVTTESYTRLHLLESHTGNIKSYSLFYTKLTGSDKLVNIPLNKVTIQLFGDNSVNFYSFNQGVKNEIKQLADIAKWSTASTPSFVARSIRSLGPSPEKDILLKMI